MSENKTTTGFLPRNTGLPMSTMLDVLSAFNSGKKVTIATSGDPDEMVRKFEYFGFKISLAQSGDSKIVYNVESIEKLKS